MLIFNHEAINSRFKKFSSFKIYVVITFFVSLLSEKLPFDILTLNHALFCGKKKRLILFCTKIILDKYVVKMVGGGEM